jgi:acyl carrier protein
MEEFIRNFAEAVETNTSDLFPDTAFKDLTLWDSMAALSVIAMVDEYYSIVLSGDQIEKSATLEDLFKLIINK